MRRGLVITCAKAEGESLDTGLGGEPGSRTHSTASIRRDFLFCRKIKCDKTSGTMAEEEEDGAARELKILTKTTWPPIFVFFCTTFTKLQTGFGLLCRPKNNYWAISFIIRSWTLFFMQVFNFRPISSCRILCKSSISIQIVQRGNNIFNSFCKMTLGNEDGMLQ